MARAQLTADLIVDRKEHVFRRQAGPVQLYKCVLCGAVTTLLPKFPTPIQWMPDRYEKVTDDDKMQCPFHFHEMIH